MLNAGVLSLLVGRAADVRGIPLDAELLNSHTLGPKLRQTEDERERDLPQK